MRHAVASLVFVLPFMTGRPLIAGPAVADKPAERPTGFASATVESSGDEKIALAFVKDNHPELASALPQLKERHPKEYQKAIHDLANNERRLAKLKERDSALYELELALWRLDSRSRYLAAKMSMSDDRGALAEKLRATVAERADLELKRKELVRDQIRRRLEKLDAEIERQKSDRSQTIERQVAKMLESADKSPKRSKGGSAKKNKPRDAAPDKPRKKAAAE